MTRTATRSRPSMQSVSSIPLLAGFEWAACTKCDNPFARRAGEASKEICPACEPRATVAMLGAQVEEEAKVFHHLDRAGVNVRRFRDATIDSFDPTHDPDAQSAAREFVDVFQERRGVAWAYMPWLFLYGAGSTDDAPGKVGNGKTHLGVGIAWHLLESGALHPKGYRFVTAESLLLEIEGTYKGDTGTSVIGLLRRYEKLDLLHIDDFGVRKPSPHAARIFDELTKRREGRATIWTSNLSPAVIGRQWGARIASRIAGEAKGRMIALNGPDRRLA